MSAPESPQLPMPTLLRRTAAWTTYGTIVVVTAVLLATWFRREFNHDDFFFAYTAWLRAVDAVPFRDYYLNTFTILSELAAPLFRYFPYSFVPLHVARAVILVVIVLLTLTIYRVTRALGVPRNWALLAPLLFICQPDVVRRMTDIRSDAVAALFLMLAAYAILAAESKRAASLAGICFGCAIALSSKIGLALPFLMAGIIFRTRGRRAVVDLAFFGAMAAIPPAAYYGWRVATDGFDVVVRVWRDLFGEMESVQRNIAGMALSFVLESPITTIAVVGGAIGWAVGARREAAHRRGALYTALALGFIGAMLTINPFLFPYNFLIIVPVIAPLAAGLRLLIRDSHALEYLLITALAFGAFSQAATPLVVVSRRNNARQIAMIEWLWRATTPQERVFDWQGMHFGRRGVFHWWHYSGRQKKYRDGWYSLDDELRQAGVTLIIDNFRLRGIKPRDRDFIRNHFVPVAPCLLSPGFATTGAELAAGARFEILTPGRYRVLSNVPVEIDGRPAGTSTVLSSGFHNIRAVDRAPGSAMLYYTTPLRERFPAPCPPPGDPLLKGFG